MKNILACLIVCAAINLGAQSTLPWNPDFNNDGVVGASDILPFLAVYGQPVGVDTSLTCEFDGSELEDWMIAVLDGSIVVDSILFQCVQADSALQYVFGCPNPEWVVVTFERAEMLYPFNSNLPNFTLFRTVPYFDGWGNSVQLEIGYHLGQYHIGMNDYYPDQFCCDYSFQGSWVGQSYLPFPESWVMSDEGVTGWPMNMMSSVEFFQILPYWHYAE